MKRSVPGWDEEQHLEVMRRVMSDQTLLPVNISIMQAWMLVSGIQLSWRHPELHAPMKAALEQVGRQFQAAIVELHPEAEPILEMGWMPEFDL